MGAAVARRLRTDDALLRPDGRVEDLGCTRGGGPPQDRLSRGARVLLLVLLSPRVLGVAGRSTQRPGKRVRGKVFGDARALRRVSKARSLRRPVRAFGGRRRPPRRARRAEDDLHQPPRAGFAIYPRRAGARNAPEALRRSGLPRPEAREGKRVRRDRRGDRAVLAVREDRGAPVPVLAAGVRPPSAVRIVAGRWKGRRLVVPRGARPTSGRAREALFDILQDTVVGIRVLELFAGSGAIGLEALSRGASEVVFVESDRDALEANLVRLLPREGEARVLATDARRATADLARAGERFQLVFADPHYALGSSAPPPPARG